MDRNFRLPRYAFLWAAVLAVCVTAARSAGEENGGIVSFSAQIAADDTPVCSAPGTGNYYATGTLRAGDIVEIFYKNENGWCAIRPPEGSYSWVNGQFVRPAADGTGTIISPSPEKEVPVRVGADSVLKSTGVQVGLKSGRTVTILGETTLTGGKRWYRIAPPSGEFRWIHLDALVPNDLLAQVPDRLVRQADVQPEAETAAAAAEELPQSILHPVRPAAPAGTAAMDEFHLELAKLQRDLFNTVERSGTIEAYELLIERAATLFSAAVDDAQRTEAQQIYQQIKAYRNGAIPTTLYNASAAMPQYAETTLYAHPLYRNMADGSAVARQQLPRERQPGRTVRTEDQRLAFSAPAASQKKSKDSDRAEKSDRSEMKFAFAGGNGPFSGFNRGKRGGSAIVPPANYRQKSPETMIADTHAMSAGIPMIGAMINQPTGAEGGQKDAGAVMMASRPDAQPVSAPEAQTAPAQGGPAQPAAGQPAEAPGGAAPAMLPIDEKPAGTPVSEPTLSTARPVSVEFPSTQYPAKDSDGWAAPGTVNQRELSAPKPLNEKKSAPAATDAAQERFDDGRFDVVGVLGYFPDRPSGYPPYAIVRSDGHALEILSYVAAEKGKNLDSFVGKKIGVNGTQGWFKRGDDNRRLITARSVFPLE